jgi:hypothetical protein
VPSANCQLLASNGWVGRLQTGDGSCTGVCGLRSDQRVIVQDARIVDVEGTGRPAWFCA